MAIVISGAGINMGGNPVSNASKIDSVLMNENGASVATETQVGTANSALVKTALNATGTAPIYACRAWVNFNGTGTVAIMASGNVSSITDNGTGNYTVNFTTAMADTNYSVSGLARDSQGNTHFPILDMGETGIKTVSSLQVFYVFDSGYYDSPEIGLHFIR